jgi:hypothetical protein
VLLAMIHSLLLQFSIKKCPNSRIPQMVAVCTGTGCQNIMKPCNVNSDCGSANLACSPFEGRFWNATAGKTEYTLTTDPAFIQREVLDVILPTFRLLNGGSSSKSYDEFKARIVGGQSSFVAYAMQQILGVFYKETNPLASQVTFCLPSFISA